MATLPNSKIVFVDFNDSFAHNILSYLYSWGEIEIINSNQIKAFLKTHKRFVWGPGPGMAHEYGIDFDALRTSLNNPQHRHFGVCLGHQLLGLALGGSYIKEDFPKHGIAERIVLPEWNDWGMHGQHITVQSYNSLAIELEATDDIRVWHQGKNLTMLATKNIFSCQFHPESVGTSCPELIFGAVRQNFL